MKKGIIFDIKHYAVHDGPGIRTTVFLKGCAANCWWCHNPESQQENIESSVKKDLVNGHVFESDENIGRVMSVDEVVKEIEKDRVFFDESGGGITFSGGEPLLQHRFLKELLLECKSIDLHTALDTTGYAKEKDFNSIMNLPELFLYDLKFMNEDLHHKYTGVSNAPMLKNLKLLIEQNKKVIMRFPMIPGITDTSKNVSEIKNYLTSFNEGIQEVNILPYHKIAGHKYRRFKKENKMIDIAEPSQKNINKLKSEFEECGFSVKIGG